MSNYDVKNKIIEVLHELNSFDRKSLQRAETLLKTINDPEGLHTLAETAKTNCLRVKYLVISHLAQFEYESVITDLITFLNDENRSIRSMARKALNSINNDSRYNHIRTLLTSPVEDTKLYAVKELGRGEQTSAVLPLINLLEDENPEIRCQVINSLRLISDPRADNPVLQKLNHPDPKTRFAAAFYAGDRKIKKSEKLLQKLLTDKHPKVRKTSAWALNCLKEKKSPQNHPPSPNLQLPTSNLQTICIFLEGSYPYVSGGVSSWVHDFINHFSDINFSLVYIGTTADELKEFKYELPKNVVSYQEIYLFDIPAEKKMGKPGEINVRHALKTVVDFFETVDDIDLKSLRILCRILGIPGEINISLKELLYSEDSWTCIRNLYDKYLPDIPFLEYLWTCRAITIPLYNLLNTKIPEASLYYTILTGYAGLLAVCARIQTGKPLLLTEHGIYHRERMMEIDKAAWIYDTCPENIPSSELLGGLKKVWNDMYRTLSSITYKMADRVTTLFRDNSLMQIEAGAKPSAIRIIPNGINFGNFSYIPEKNIQNTELYRIDLVGRVVSIKDVKTFIWAAKTIREKLNDKARFRVMGPLDEEPEYAEECKTLVSLLNLQDVFTFTGQVNLAEAFKQTHILVLTSISEGQPLSVMEAMAAAIPCVVTNVGACRELMYGKDHEDEKTGKAGIVTGVHSPGEIAEAVVAILKNPQRYQTMAKAGRARISANYRSTDIYDKYRSLIQSLTNPRDWNPEKYTPETFYREINL